MWFWLRWPCRLSLNDEPVAWQHPSQPLGSESPNALPARMAMILAMENLDPTLHPEMVRRGFILDSVQNCSCVRAMLFRNTVTYATFNCRMVSSVGRAPLCWEEGGGGYWELPGRLVIRDGKQRLVVLRGWGLRSKYRKQQRGAGHCKVRKGKQKEKHQCAMFWPGLICASEDTKRVLSTAKKHWALPGMGSFYVSGKLPTYPSTKPTLTLSSYLGQNVGLGEG